MKKLLLFSSFFLTCLGARAELLRSAALYFNPADQIEVDANLGYLNRERRVNNFQTRSSVTLTGLRFEHGLNEKMSWGANLNYGSGDGEIKGRTGKQSQSYAGLYDPEIVLKYHLTTESFRFHSNGIFSIKNDSQVLGNDGNPINFASGGSALAIQLGLERDLGPLITGVDLRTDLWRDTQEIVQRDTSVISYQTDALYFREGAKISSASVFGELNNLKSIKPGLRLRATQIDSSVTTPQSNPNLTNTASSLQYKLPKEQLIGMSVYGRVKIRSQIVLNFELASTEFYQNSSLNDMVGRTYSLTSNIGYKF